MASKIFYSTYLRVKILFIIVFIVKVHQGVNPVLFLLRQSMPQTDRNVAMALSTSSIGWMGR